LMSTPKQEHAQFRRTPRAGAIIPKADLYIRSQIHIP
jgi:hypothetical protein